MSMICPNPIAEYKENPASCEENLSTPLFTGSRVEPLSSSLTPPLFAEMAPLCRSGKPVEKSHLSRLFSGSSRSDPTLMIGAVSSVGRSLRSVVLLPRSNIPFTETHLGSLTILLRNYERGVIQPILTRFPASRLGEQMQWLTGEINELAKGSLPQKVTRLFNDILSEAEVWELRKDFDYVRDRLRTSRSFSLSEEELANKLLGRIQSITGKIREMKEVAQWIERELQLQGTVPKIFQGDFPLSAGDVLQKAREANDTFRISQRLKDLKETAELASIAAKESFGRSGWRFRMPTASYPTPAIENASGFSFSCDPAAKNIVDTFTRFIDQEGQLIREGMVRPGFWGVNASDFAAGHVRSTIPFHPAEMTESEVFAVQRYLRNLPLAERSSFLGRFGESGKAILHYLQQTYPADFPVSVNPENISQAALIRRIADLPLPKGATVLFDETAIPTTEIIYPLHPEDLEVIETLPQRTERAFTTLREVTVNRTFGEGLNVTRGKELLPQIPRLSLWTYLGIGANIAGAVVGPFATLYSFGLTVWDAFFNPKVSWLEVAVDAGITAVTGAATFYAIGGALYTGLWYFLTGTIAFAGAPWAIGAALLVSGIGLAYSKEGLREDRDAREVHETFIKSGSIEKRARELATLIQRKDEDEVVNKSLEELKRKNKELLNPNNPEAQALWRSSIKGEKGEKPFGEGMRDAIRHWSSFVGSGDDAVSLMVIAQMMGNPKDLTDALEKVDPESYEKFRYGIPGLKSFEELKKQGLAPVVQPDSSPNRENKINSIEWVCEAEIVYSEMGEEA